MYLREKQAVSQSPSYQDPVARKVRKFAWRQLNRFQRNEPNMLLHFSYIILNERLSSTV